MKKFSTYQRLILVSLIILLCGCFLPCGLSLQVEAAGDSYKKAVNLVSDLKVKAEIQEKFPKLLEQDPTLADDFHLPYLHLVSPDAQAFNAEIRELLDRVYAGFSENYTPWLYASYETYAYEDYFSLLMKISVWSDINIYFERAYCFHLPSGKRLSNEEILAAVGLSGSSIEQIAEDTIFYYNRIHIPFDKHLTQMEKYSLGCTLDWIWQGTTASELYLDNTGRLMLNQMIHVPAGSGEGYTQIEALKPVLAVEKPLNGLYVELAQELGDFDPYADTAPVALLAYVGEQTPGDIDSLDAIFQKVSCLLTGFERYNVPSLFYNVKYNEETRATEADGDGFFLLVPRLERQLISLGYTDMEEPEATAYGYTLDDSALLVQELGPKAKDVPCFLRDKEGTHIFYIKTDEQGRLQELPPNFYDFSEYMTHVDVDDLLFYVVGFYEEYELFLNLYDFE